MSSEPSRPRAVTVRTRPRISLNKLAEYLVANATRRRQILRDQKRPSDFKVIRYEDAQRAIVDHLVHGATDPEVLSQHLSRLVNWTRGVKDSDFDEQKNRNCREAIEAYIRAADRFDLRGLTMSPSRTRHQKLVKCGVQVSIRPELLITGVGRSGEGFSGGLKLYFSKTTVLDEAAAAYVTTILHEYIERHHSTSVACDHRRCHAIDVFAGAMHTAPKNFVRRRSEVEAACEEIASRWESV